MSSTPYVRRVHAAFIALLFVVASVLPIFNFGSASAYTLLGDREIKMETAVVSATDTSYRVRFEATTAGSVGGIVVAFCENTPIVRDSACVHPTGFDLPGAVGFADRSDGTADEGDATANITSLDTVTLLDQDDTALNTNTFVLSGATQATVAAGDVIHFEITGIENPSALGTFYARIMTYETNTHATGYTLANPDVAGPIVDGGGIALSTADVITIEAKVQERLEFCIYTGASTSWNQDDCSAPDNPVILGDNNGVLDFVNPSINRDARFNITTNASAGATIRMKGDTLRSGPTFEIASIGATALASDEGTEQFGMCVFSDTDTLFDASSLSPVSPYNSVDCTNTIGGQAANNDAGATFAFDDNVTDGTLSTYGSPIATKAAGDWSTGVLVFLGNISSTTEPGIYTTSLDFIATGRY